MTAHSQTVYLNLTSSPLMLPHIADAADKALPPSTQPPLYLLLHAKSYTSHYSQYYDDTHFKPSVLLTDCLISMSRTLALVVCTLLINSSLSPYRRRTLWLCLRSQTTRVQLVWITQPTLQRTRPSPPFQTAQLCSSSPPKQRPQTPKRLITVWVRSTRCPG